MSRDRDVVEKVIASLKNIGRFELSPLRESENGACYKAVDPNRRIAVSIRILWPHDFADGDEQVRKLFTQARAAQALEHGNIAKVIGSGELDGAFFVVSSFVDGYSLRQNIERSEHLNTWDLIDFARQACVGLESAHARGIVHHALHPENIVLEFDGTTKILDLGLYRGHNPETDPFHPSALYLAPEQIAGHGADRFTNFYSIAVMLYEIATGKLPFAGDSWQTLAESAQNEIAEPIKLSAAVPPGINAAIMKALSRDRSARFQSGPELVRALEEYKAFGKPPSPVAPPPKPKVVPINGNTGAAAAPAPVRNPFATAPDLVHPNDSEIEAPSRVISERPMIVDVQDSGTWKRPAPPVAPPPPEPEVIHEPYVESPSKRKVAQEVVLRLAQQAWKVSWKELRKVDPWVYALAFIIIVLASFITRTIAMSFWGTPEENEYTIRQPAPIPAAPPQTASPQQAPAPEMTVPAPEQRAATGAPRRGSHKIPSGVAPALFTPARPLPYAGYSSAMTGTVMVATTPAGARVIVDGKTSQVFTTPQVIPSLAPGIHTLTISKDGYAQATRPVQITAGAQSHLNVQLDLPSGFITVLSNPSTAYIVIDGVSTGHVTPSQVPVSPGTHTLTLRKLGYLEASDTFSVKSGEQQSRNVTLLEAGSTPDIRVAQTSGVRKMFGGNKVTGVRLTVRTTPPGATVVIDGQMVPRTTPVDFGLNPGSYVMEIQLQGYHMLRKTITVQEGSPLVFNETLQP